MNITKTITIAITTLFFAPAAFAGSPAEAGSSAKRQQARTAGLAGGTVAGTARVAVRDHRGKLKHKKKRRQMLRRFDTNRDGQLSPAERRTARRVRANRRYKKLLRTYDRNRDGMLSWGEINKRPRGAHKASGQRKMKQQRQKLRKMFRRADRNHDRVVTRAEFQRMALVKGKNKRKKMRKGKRVSPPRRA